MIIEMLKLFLVALSPILFIYSLVALINERKGREHYVVIISALLISIAAFSNGLKSIDSNEIYEGIHDLAELSAMVLLFFVLREHIHEHLHYVRKKTGK